MTAAAFTAAAGTALYVAYRYGLEAGVARHAQQREGEGQECGGGKSRHHTLAPEQPPLTRPQPIRVSVLRGGNSPESTSLSPHPIEASDGEEPITPPTRPGTPITANGRRLWCVTAPLAAHERRAFCLTKSMELACCSVHRRASPRSTALLADGSIWVSEEIGFASSPGGTHRGVDPGSNGCSVVAFTHSLLRSPPLRL